MLNKVTLSLSFISQEIELKYVIEKGFSYQIKKKCKTILFSLWILNQQNVITINQDNLWDWLNKFHKFDMQFWSGFKKITQQ